MEIAVVLFVLTGTLVFGLNRVQVQQRYHPYSEQEIRLLRSLYQVHLAEGSTPVFSLPIQRRIWQEEQVKYHKEISLYVDENGFGRH